MQAVNLFLELDEKEELPIEILETALESTLEILSLTKLKPSDTAENPVNAGLAITSQALMLFRRKELLKSAKAKLLMDDTDTIISNLFLTKSESFVTYFLTQKLKYMDSSHPLFAQYLGLLSMVLFGVILLRSYRGKH